MVRLRSIAIAALVLASAATAQAGGLVCNYAVSKFVSCKPASDECRDGVELHDIEQSVFRQEAADENMFEFQFSPKSKEAREIVISGFATPEKILDLEIANTKTKMKSNASMNHEKPAQEFELMLRHEVAGGFDVHVLCNTR